MATNMKVITVSVDSVDSTTDDFLTRLSTAVNDAIAESPDFSGGFRIVQVFPTKAGGSGRTSYEIWVENT